MASHPQCRIRAGRSARRRGSVLGLALGLVLTLLAQPAAALDWPDSRFGDWDREAKVTAVNAAGAVFIMGWGLANWDYFQRSPRADSEDWFGADTREGGADKLGHAYVNYGLTHGLAALYEHWGYTRGAAARNAAWSSFGLTGLMEAGDAFSGDYGFSYEDMVMNAAGALVGYLTWTRPALARRLDIRVELEPEFDRLDVFTDYENLKYLLALKLDGFDNLRDTPLRYLELQLGYYARNYSSPDTGNRERNAYIGIGINLSRIFTDLDHPRIGRVFNYIQPPGTHTEWRTDLND